MARPNYQKQPPSGIKGLTPAGRSRRPSSQRNVNSAASRIAQQEGGRSNINARRTPPRFSSPSMEWNQSGGPRQLGREGQERARANRPPSFLFGDAPSLESFLSQAMAASGADQYGNRIADTERRKAEALQAILHGSEELARRVEQGRGDVDERYKQSIAESAESGEAARAALIQQYAAARAAQEATNRNLGIAVDQSRAVGDEAFGAGQVTSENQAAQDALRSNQTSQYALGTTNIGAARGRGLEDQNFARRQYDSAIAELLDMQAQARAEAQQRAAQMHSQAYGQWADQRDFGYNEWRRQQENERDDARWLLEQQMRNQPEAPELSPYEQYMAAQQRAGVTPGKADQWMNQAIRGSSAGLPMDRWIGGGSSEAQANLLAFLRAQGYAIR